MSSNYAPDPTDHLKPAYGVSGIYGGSGVYGGNPVYGGSGANVAKAPTVYENKLFKHRVSDREETGEACHSWDTVK